MKDIRVREIVHALRSPLTAIVSNIDLLINGYIEGVDDSIKEVLLDVDFNAQYMETIMRNASDVAKIKSADDVIKGEVNVNNTVNEIMENISSVIKEIKTKVNITMDNDITIIAEPDMAKRFFHLLIYELFKFTGNDTKLSLTFTKKGKGVNIDIMYNKDSNKKPEVYENIFKTVFIDPSERKNILNGEYFRKFLELFDGKSKIMKKDNQVMLHISIQ